MNRQDFLDIAQYIIEQTIKLKSKYNLGINAPVEFACIFCQNENEYLQLTEVIGKLGKVVQDTPTGYTYLLDESIQTKAGPLRLVKIRKSDPKHKERGDADFNTEYPELKEKYLNNSHFELIKRDDFEMLRLTDSEFDVMVCFSNIPLSKNLN